MKKKRIAIDLDGVLVDGKGIPRKPDLNDYKPKKNAVKAIRFLKSLGYECFILTARGEHEFKDINNWLEKYEFPKMEVTNRKMNAVAYIDDRAIRFTDWQDICRYFG